jgi:hypothetical protein
MATRTWCPMISTLFAICRKISSRNKGEGWGKQRERRAKIRCVVLRQMDWKKQWSQENTVKRWCDSSVIEN